MRGLAAGVLVLAIGALALYAVRDQRNATREILARLDDLRGALRDESQRSAELAGQVSALTERVAGLEADNRDLRSQIAKLLNRRPVEVAAAALPAPLAAAALAPIAEHSIAESSLVVSEPIPITWAVDWTAYQPAGIIAPPAPLVLERRLTDPAFVKKLYYGFGALQATDAVTTLVSVGRGARETNPLLQGAARNPAAMFALKAGVVAGTVFTLEKLRKDHPAIAVATLIAINSTLAVVAVNNVTVAVRQDRP
jgi:hypothetical protein